MHSPRQITLRNPSEELVRRLRELAATRGWSLNTTILRVLEEAVGANEKRKRLERYAGWNKAELREFERALRAQRQVDEGLWK